MEGRRISGPGHALKGSTRQVTSERSCAIQVEEPEAVIIRKPSEDDINEIVGCLKLKRSMLTVGACERVRKLCKVHPNDCLHDAILGALIELLVDAPASPVAGAAMEALSMLALTPEGRQKVCLSGGAIPLLRYLAKADVQSSNTSTALKLLTNLAADCVNRRSIRDAGAVEAVVAVIKVADAAEEQVMVAALGAMHNLALLDAKAKTRAVQAGVLAPLLCIVTGKSTRPPPPPAVAASMSVSSSNSVDEPLSQIRARMLLTELIKMPGVEEQLLKTAEQLQIRL